MISHCRSVRNVYGPTETTIWSSSFTMPKDFASLSASGGGSGGGKASQPPTIPIGMPISLTDFYLASEANVNVQVGFGEEGELLIGGVGVARGYLHAPDLTVGRFIPNPYGGSGRVYRTGDLVKQLKNGGPGDYVFVRRMDDQVKIDGFRIELAEIEQVFSSHHLIDQAVALVRNGRLALYLKAAAGASLGSKEQDQVKEAAARSLTYYMMPKDIVIVTSFPQTANGKLDRKALPDPPPLLEYAKVGSIALSSSSTTTTTTTTTSTAESITRRIQAKNTSHIMEHHVIDCIFKIKGRRPPPHASFASIGVDSLGSIVFIKVLSDTLGGIKITPAKIYSPGVTLRTFSKELSARVVAERPTVAEAMGLLAVEDAVASEENGGSVSVELVRVQGGVEYDLQQQHDRLEVNGNEKKEESDKPEEEDEQEGPDGLWAWERRQEADFENVIAKNRNIFEGLRGVFAFLVLWDHFHSLETAGKFLYSL